MPCWSCSTPTGIRVAECCGLDGTDVDRSHGTVRVLGKGDKERVVPVGEVALEAIDAYLAARGRPRRAALHQRSRGAAHDAERAAHRRQAGAPQRDEPPGDAAYAPPHVRHPHAGRRGGPAPHPGAARAPAALHHPALHAREPRASHEGVRRRPPPRDLTDAMTGERRRVSRDDGGLRAPSRAGGAGRGRPGLDRPDDREGRRAKGPQGLPRPRARGLRGRGGRRVHALRASSRPSSRSIGAICRARRSSWPRTGGWTGCSGGWRPCSPWPTRSRPSSSRAPAT